LRGRCQDARTPINCEPRLPGLGAFCARSALQSGNKDTNAGTLQEIVSFAEFFLGVTEALGG
jgi:hypothetical protein